MKDFLDREIHEGDEIAYATRHSSSMDLVHAKVLKAEEKKLKVQPLSRKGWSYYVDRETRQKVYAGDNPERYIKTHDHYRHRVTGEIASLQELNLIRQAYYRRPIHDKPEKQPQDYLYVPAVYTDMYVRIDPPAKPVTLQTPYYVVRL